MAHAAGSLKPAQRTAALPLLGPIPRDGANVVVVVGCGASTDQRKAGCRCRKKQNGTERLHQFDRRSGLMDHKVTREGRMLQIIRQNLGDTIVRGDGDNLYFTHEFGVTVH